MTRRMGHLQRVKHAGRPTIEALSGADTRRGPPEQQFRGYAGGGGGYAQRHIGLHRCVPTAMGLRRGGWRVEGVTG